MVNTGKIGSISSIKPNGIDTDLSKKLEKGDGAEFKKSLELELDKKKDIESSDGKFTLQFSAHAVERMQKRGIHFTPTDISKIEDAANKASAKGAKESLILTDETAMIVNLKDKKIVTVMDREMMKENVFTNIDSTVFI